MTAKDYLKQLYKLDKNIQTTVSELKEQEILKESISSPNLSSTSSGSGNRNNAPFVSIIERIEILKDRINGYMHDKNAIVDEIRSLDNAVHIDILFKYYVERKNLEKIAVEIGYERDYTRNLKGKALKEFEEKILKNKINTQNHTKSHKIT